MLPSPQSSSSVSDAGQLTDKQECASTDTRVSPGTPSQGGSQSPRGAPEAAPLPGWNCVDCCPGRRLRKAAESSKCLGSPPAEVMIAGSSGRSGMQGAYASHCCCPHSQESDDSHERSCSRRGGSEARAPAEGGSSSIWKSCCHHSCSEARRDCPTHLPKWQKILWKKQPHPDCYVDETFLNTLMRNANLTRYIYSELCKSTVVLTQHLSCILIFLLIYRMIVRRSIEASTLVIFDVIALPVGYALRWSLRPAPRGARMPHRGRKGTWAVSPSILTPFSPLIRLPCGCEV